MPWKRSGNDLVLIEPVHFDADEIRNLISHLREAHRKAEPVAGLLEKLVADGLASEHLVFQFSKWCKWSHENSEIIARLIASKLFYDYVSPRLWDEHDRKIPDPQTADANYRTWMDLVLRASQGLPADTVFPDDAAHMRTYVEGAVVQRLVNAYERDSEARRASIQHDGRRCCICNFDFGRAYHGIGTGHVHDHHLRPLSQTRESHQVDPIADLLPVCPNCHLVIHLYRTPFSIDDVKAMVARARELNPDGPFE